MYEHYAGLYDVRLNCGADRDGSQEERGTSGSGDDAAGGPDCEWKERGTSGSGDDAAGGPDCEWKERMRYFRHDVSSGGHPFYYLEAVGWVCGYLHF